MDAQELFEELKDKVGPALKALQECIGKSQICICKLLDKEPGWLDRIGHGHEGISFKDFQKACVALGFEPQVFLNHLKADANSRKVP